MSTHCNIGIQELDGSVRYIYCHYDGYPSHIVPLLINHYATESAVRELLSLGNLRALDYSTTVSVAYHRDRGEALTISRAQSPSHIDLMEYNYLFKAQSGQWWLGTGRGSGSWCQIERDFNPHAWQRALHLARNAQY